MKFIVLFVALYLLFGLKLVLDFTTKSNVNKQISDASLIENLIFYVCAMLIGPVIYLSALLERIVEAYRRRK